MKTFTILSAFIITTAHSRDASTVNPTGLWAKPFRNMLKYSCWFSTRPPPLGLNSHKGTPIRAKLVNSIKPETATLWNSNLLCSIMLFGAEKTLFWDGILSRGPLIIACRPWLNDEEGEKKQLETTLPILWAKTFLAAAVMRASCKKKKWERENKKI